MTKEDVEGWKEGTEARNDEPRRGSKNRRAFRETTAVGERREEDLGEGRGGGERGGRKRGTRESDSRGASAVVTVEGTGGRARSGGNSAINTNIFRSVLQPCFDNHPHQRVPSPSCDSARRPPSEPLSFPPRPTRSRSSPSPRIPRILNT